MNWDGFGFYFRVLIELGAVLLAVYTLYAIVKFWKKMSLGQKFFGIGLFFFQLYILDITREALVDDFGWRWRLILLLIAQFCFVIYMLEPAKRRREHAEQLQKILNGEDEEKSS